MAYASSLGPGCCCGGGGGGPPTDSYPGCFCATVPHTITMTSASHTCASGQFQDATFVYGPTPAAVTAAGFPPGTAYWATAPTTDPTFGGQWYYRINCSFHTFFLCQFYISGPFGGSQGFTLYRWTVITANNTCSPFSLIEGCADNGSGFGCPGAGDCVGSTTGVGFLTLTG